MQTKLLETTKLAHVTLSVIAVTQSNGWVYMVVDYNGRRLFCRFHLKTFAYEDLALLEVDRLNDLVTVKSMNEFVFFFYRDGSVTAYHKGDRYFDTDLANWLPARLRVECKGF